MTDHSRPGEIKNDGIVSDCEKEALEIVEKALLQNDLARAAAVLNQLKANASPKFLALCNQITKRYSELESIENESEQGFRSLGSGDVENAVVLFKSVIEKSPDHEKARAGLQQALNYRDWRNQVELVLLQAQKAESDGDFETARERCQEVLRLAPDNVFATQFLSEINHWIEKRLQAWHMVLQGERLFLDHKYEEAIKVWDSISGIDQSFREGLPLIEKAKACIDSRDYESIAKNVLRDAQRAYDNKQFQIAVEILYNFPEKTSLSLDASLLLRRAKDAYEKMTLTSDLELKLKNAIANRNHSLAKDLFRLLLQLDPESRLINEISREIDSLPQ